MLNRKLEGMNSTSNELHAVSTLWKHFHDLMRESQVGG